MPFIGHGCEDVVVLTVLWHGVVGVRMQHMMLCRMLGRCRGLLNWSSPLTEKGGKPVIIGPEDQQECAVSVFAA